LRAQTPAEVRFNYLGQLDRALPESDLIKPVTESSGGSLALSGGQLQSPLNRRGYLLNIIGSVSGGVLRLEWSYSANLHRRETVEKLASSYVSELRALIAHSRKAGTESFSPTDFPSANLSQSDLSNVLAQLRNRER
jgi:non-ribosomal peptide synthase protein (TIGR01720 family)